MINYVDTSLMKRKFAKLLSALYYSANIELANISHKFIYGDYFDSLEKNILDNLSKPIDTIVYDLFKAPLLIDDIQDIGPIYWSGLQYMNLFLNYSIPIKTLFLVCPLEIMITHYTIYHEMSEIQFCEMFIKNYYSKPILKLLRKEKRLTVAELATLTNISIPTINYYETSNSKLFNASYKNISEISKVLGVSEIFFKRESDFVPISEYLNQDIDFITCFSKIINSYFGLKNNGLIAIDPFEDVEVPYLAINNPNYLYLENKKIIINDDLLVLFFKSALRDFKSIYSWKSLIF